MRRLLTAILTLCCLHLSLPTQALGLIVVGDNFYLVASSHPGKGSNTITIEPGETVRWSWLGNASHTVTSDTLVNSSPLFASPIGRRGATFEYTFNDPGEYPYHCLLHPHQMGMVMVMGQPASVPEPTALGWLTGFACTLFLFCHRPLWTRLRSQ